MGIMGEIISTPSYFCDSISVILDDGRCFVDDLEPMEYLGGHADNDRLKNEWNVVMSYKLQIVYYAHANEKVLQLIKFSLEKRLKATENFEVLGEKHIIRIRPYKTTDANTILSWCQDEKAFYQWTAGVMGGPITQNEFGFVENLIPFTVFDEDGIVGFFTLRNPNEFLDELRFGFVIVNPDKRCQGYEKAMLQLGLKFAFEIYGAIRASLRAFENNLSAYYCYKAVGVMNQRVLDDDILHIPRMHYVRFFYMQRIKMYWIPCQR